MSDPTLFDHARTTDPQPSHDAAAAIVPTLGASCAQVLTVVARLGTATADDVVAQIPGSQRNVIARRLTDLADWIETFRTSTGHLMDDYVPLIVECGTRQNLRNRPVTLWRLTPSGERMVRLLNPEQTR